MSGIIFAVKIHDECLWLVPCPGPKCARILEEETIRRLIQSTDVLNDYQKHVLKSFVLVGFKQYFSFLILKYLRVAQH